MRDLSFRSAMFFSDSVESACERTVVVPYTFEKILYLRKTSRLFSDFIL